MASADRGGNWGSDREIDVHQITAEWAYFYELWAVLLTLQMQPKFPLTPAQSLALGSPGCIWGIMAELYWKMQEPIDFL